MTTVPLPELPDSGLDGFELPHAASTRDAVAAMATTALPRSVRFDLNMWDVSFQGRNRHSYRELRACRRRPRGTTSRRRPVNAAWTSSARTTITAAPPATSP